MAINIDVTAEQTDRLVAAIEAACFSYAYQTGYMRHAQDLYEEEKKSNPGLSGSYALKANITPEPTDKLYELIVKLLKNPDFERIVDKHIDQSLDFTKELTKK